MTYLRSLAHCVCCQAFLKYAIRNESVGVSLGAEAISRRRRFSSLVNNPKTVRFVVASSLFALASKLSKNVKINLVEQHLIFMQDFAET